MMRCRKASDSDIGWLGEMNHQLIADERHSNPMDVAQLQERMRGWLLGEYIALVFEDDTGPVGYALLKEESDRVYLRQFFIVRHRRRQGLGRAAMEHLFSYVVPLKRKVVLDVLTHNQAAIQFYQALGFTPYCLTMQRVPLPS
ncbi:MAG: GNAT family N-acetyltransferase [Limisphaerales bacterium]